MTEKSEERIAELEAEIAIERPQRDEERSRSKRLKHSLSWRLTLPIRALWSLAIAPFSRPKPVPSTTAPEESSERAPDPEAAENVPIEPQGPPLPYRDYADFCQRMEPLIDSYCDSFPKRLNRLPSRPLISVVLPVYNPDPKWLELAIESVVDQIYPDWELCIADDASTREGIEPLLRQYAAGNPKIKVVFRESNGHISAASNSALELASGDFIALLDHDDLLSRHALARVVDRINETPDSVIIYSDEDKVDEFGRRSQPHFKSNWNPDLLLGQNCISHLGVYRRSYVERVSGFRRGYEGAQDWDLALRVSELCEPDQIQHIPETLYHWRSIKGSTARDIDEKDYAHEAAGKALADRFRRLNIDVELEPVDRYYWRPVYKLPDPLPSVAIIIPTRDRVDLLKPCIDSILQKTRYTNYKIVIVDNDSTEPETLEYLENAKKQGIESLRVSGAFNYSRINNVAIRERSESLVCLLNNDTTVLNPDWLEEMAMHACRDEIGVVGAKLLFPHDHVQHAGVVLGIGGIGSEAFKYIHKTDDGYIHRAFLIGNYSAVTGACMVFRKSVWELLQGLNESDTPNAYSDIDFCLRATESGLRTLFTPFATLHHHQSASRGPDDHEEFENASQYMRARWGASIANDPFYNPNLTLEREDFTLSFPPRNYPAE